MVVQPFEIYQELSRVGLDRTAHTRVVGGLHLPPIKDISNYSHLQTMSIGVNVGIPVSRDIVNLYGLLRLDSEEVFLSDPQQLPLCSDQVLVHEAFAFHADTGATEKMACYYDNIFRERIK